MSFEIASVTSCGQSLLAQASASNRLRFVNARIETAARTAQEIGDATTLPSLANPVTGAISSVTYSLNQTRVTVRFTNLETTFNFHTVWLMAKLEGQPDSAAVPICAIVSADPVYIPTTAQSESHIDIHMNLSFVNADGTVSITEGPAITVSDYELFRNEVGNAFLQFSALLDTLNGNMVTLDGTQTVTGSKTFSNGAKFGGHVTLSGTLSVSNATTLGYVYCGSVSAGVITSYNITPRSAVSYDIGSTSYRWRNVYAQTGNFSSSVTSSGTLSVSGTSTLGGDTTVGGTLDVTGSTTLANATANAFTAATVTVGDVKLSKTTGNWGDRLTVECNIAQPTNGSYTLGLENLRWSAVYAQNGNYSGTMTVSGLSTFSTVTAGAISSYGINPRSAISYDLGSSGTRWRSVYAQHGYFSTSLTSTGTLSVSGTSTLGGDATVVGTLGVSGQATFKGNARIPSGKRIYFGNDESVYINLYNSGIDVKGSLTPVGNGNQNFGSPSYKWANIYANTIDGNAVAKALCGNNYNTTMYNSVGAIGLFLFTTSSSSGWLGAGQNLSGGTLYPVALNYASNGSNTDLRLSSASSGTVSGTWCTLSAMDHSAKNLVLAVRIA